jgi:hypothetical protein
MMNLEDCWDCQHTGAEHPMEDASDLPPAIRSAPCAVDGCDCSDFGGPGHPERPPLADFVVDPAEFGGGS